MGLKRLTDTVNNQKRAHLFRKTSKQGQTKNALIAIVGMACRERGKQTKNNLVSEINGEIKIKDKLWMNSIIEDASSLNVKLTIGGLYEDNDQSWPENSIDNSSIKPGQNFEMDRLTIRGENWYSKMNMGYVAITRELSIMYRHQLQTDQAYLTEDGKKILEILGTHGYEECPDLEVRIWEEIEGYNIMEGAEVKLSQLTPSCGMGCNKREKWNIIFTNTRMKRVIMSNDSYLYDVITRRVKIY